MIIHHPPEDRLAAYAAGSAGEADALLVASHLVLCPDCRRRVAEYEALGGVMLEELPDEALADGSLAQTLSRLAEMAPEPPRPPPPGAGPGFRFHRLPMAGGRAWLLQVAPGRGVPHHGRDGDEMVMVLAGSYRDG